MARSRAQGAQLDLELGMELGMVLELEYAGGEIAEEQKGEGKA